jgi:ankyrin repeat protein
LKNISATATHFRYHEMKNQTLKEILQSTSDSLFPAELGNAVVQIDSTDCNGDTPLHVLIWRNDTAGAILLIENGAPIDAAGDMGETPLHAAVANQNMAIIQALMKAGARTDIKSEFGKTALKSAAEKGIALVRDP